MSGTAKPLNALLSASMECLLVFVVPAQPVAQIVAAPVRGPQGEAPAHPLAVPEQPLERAAPHRHEAHAAVLEMHYGTVERVCRERAAGAGPDHGDSSSRSGRPKRSKVANSRLGSMGSSTQRP